LSEIPSAVLLVCRQIVGVIFTQVLRHMKGGHLRWCCTNEFKVMQPVFFVVVATDKCVRVAGSHMVYSRRERFVFCSCRWVVKDVRMFWSYPHHNISGAGHVTSCSWISRASAGLRVIHHHFLRKFRRGRGTGSDRVFHITSSI